MDKLRMQSLDKTKCNVEKLKELFPNAVTEVKGSDGKIDYAIDFDVLKQELSPEIVEGREERYQFTWPGKREAILLANTPITKTLRPCKKESVDFDNTQNLYIEGDNLEVLKLLQETYLHSIDVIYIDPPYNTGNDFLYNDDYAQNKEDYEKTTGQRDEKGNPMVLNPESNGRFHSDWCSMIYPRLKLAKDLLSDDGVIFLSIDNNETENLEKICNEIFGERNFITKFIWHNNKKGRQMDKRIKTTCEYILMFAKSISKLQVATKKVEAEPGEYELRDGISSYTKGYPLHNGNANVHINSNPNLCYSIYYSLSGNPPVILDERVKTDAGYKLEISEKGKELLKDGYVRIVPKLNNKYGTQRAWRWGREKFMKEYKTELMLVKENDGYYFYQKERLNEEGLREQRFTNYIDIDTSRGKNEINNLFNNRVVFDFPKPVDLIKHLLLTVSGKDFIVLDLFSGSATTAQSVVQLNAEDGGHRKFIMVQAREKCAKNSEALKAGYENICEIGKERIRRAGKKILEENPSARGSLDVGFRVLKLKDSNMEDVYYDPASTKQSELSMTIDCVKQGREPIDLLFQVMLEFDKPLSSKIEEIEIYEGKKAFSVDGNDMICCLDGGVISDELVEAIAKLKPLYAVFRDSSFADDSVRGNCGQLFAKFSPATIYRVI